MPKSWVFLLPEGQVVVDERTETMSAARLKAIASETNRALSNFAKRAPRDATPFRFPVLVQHKQRGYRLGDIVEAKYAISGQKRGLWALTSWLPDVWKQIKASKIQHVSVGIPPAFQDDAGVDYNELLMEFSVTDHPVIKTIGTIQDTLGLKLAAPPTLRRFAAQRPQERRVMLDDKDKKEIAKLIQAGIKAAMPDLIAGIKASTAEIADTVDEEVTDTTELSEDYDDELDMSEDYDELEAAEEEDKAKIAAAAKLNREYKRAMIKLANTLPRLSQINTVERGGAGGKPARTSGKTPDDIYKAVYAREIKAGKKPQAARVTAMAAAYK